MPEKDLTLLIPMYNKAKYIERMVKSLSEQTYLPRTKILVTDDCSTDGSLDVLKKFAEEFGIEMGVRINRKNLGLSLTIRNMYRKIETPFWTVLDPDDYYIDPRRHERAVEFLKSNPDHSMHGCNYFLEYGDGRREIAIPESLDNYSTSNLRTMPFFQTSSGTFRNFWTHDLLLELERCAGKNHYHFTQGDSFRNFCAIHSGKAYFDNFAGSVYTMSVGIWDTMSPIEKNVMNMVASYRLFEFSRDFFRNAANANFSLMNSHALYLQILESIKEILQNHTEDLFQASNYFKNLCEVKNGDFEDLMQVIVDYSQKFRSLGFGAQK